MVFVLDANKKPLSPCHPAKARKLLKEGKAAIYKRYPFTIILKKIVNDKNTHEYRLKIDYGSKHTGLAILNGENVVWFGNVACRSNGYFCIKNQNKINVNYKYLKMVQRFDGYIYSFVVYV